mgnify:FL=1
MLEHVRKLEAGLVGQKSERHVPSSEQLTMDVVSTLVGEATDEVVTPATTTTVERHEREKPTGRKPLPEKLPRVVIDVLPPDMQRQRRPSSCQFREASQARACWPTPS